MKPVSISHANVSLVNSFKIVVVEVELTPQDKDMIHSYHLAHNDFDYDKDDVSFLAFIHVDAEGLVTGYHYKDNCYYPEGYGELLINNDNLPKELEQECIDFVKSHYVGNESKYDRS